MTVIARTRAEIVAQDDLARALSRGDVQGVHKARLAVAVVERDHARGQLQGAVEALRLAGEANKRIGEQRDAARAEVERLQDEVRRITTTWGQ